jgi:hypothetical protein
MYECWRIRDLALLRAAQLGSDKPRNSALKNANSGEEKAFAAFVTTPTL